MAQVEYAGPGRRLAALLVDIILAIAVVACALLVWMTITGEAFDTGSSLARFAFAGGAAVGLAMKIALDAWVQGTPGLRLMDCRVVDACSGRRIGFYRSIIRTLGLIPAVAPGLLGLLWMFWNKRRQGWHDLIADSIVIREDESLKSLQQLAREAR